jgi:ribosomal protein S18 acetylase RimI-like enzyme
MERAHTTVEVVTSLTKEIEEAVTRLLPQLSSSAVFDPERLRSVIRDTASTLLLARFNDEVILGMATIVTYSIPTGLRAHLDDVVVDESARGLGVGDQLVSAALELARQAGAKTIDLSSRPSREAALRLYARAGFIERESRLYRVVL